MIGGMSYASTVYVPSSRPSLVDYFLLLLGCSLSLFLVRSLGRITVTPNDGLSEPLADLTAALGDLMRMPEGIVLLWPVFLLFQKLRGRKQGLTAGEWLWVIAWLGVALLTGLSAWEKWWGPLPEWL